ncbi:hypothetical protein GCM10011376_35900 [Nocardioides flavus (ex Wang et al. 2016)]|uniref:Nudix hydrolase domain-containing protein n=1 Tax=Nocardioides flavus (ex Wang et al. 2016) TaxID=2058780 RepID=A0ABQ3HMS0_9ACTN|nr:NUDIX hydrolase [Nocardioides flavus (ex Wang et al. 2016)]GHE18980.1 hypothetical protein GCM10011376_35900 [Nocardioides flavus (ex Wang et al. 2016)]
MSRMDSHGDDGRRRFPRLFEESYVDYAGARVAYSGGAPPDELVSRLHLVAVTEGAEVVVCRSARGERFLPGGTREPGESLLDLARRELAEEAGAELLGELVHFSAHRADSHLDRPYRHHLPHPRAYWGYAVGRVQIVGPPLNPVDGEQVVQVLTMPPQEAADYLGDEDPIHSDVLRHAIALGLLHQSQ